MVSRILVVDDLLPNVRLLKAKLENEFYTVDTACNGVEALDMIKKYPPDVVLLDVMMPQMDGFETCKRIKETPETADIPVVMVTALSDMEDRVKGLTVGADDFLTKPINDLALFARIRSLVRLKSMTDELKLRDQTGKQLGSSEGHFQSIRNTEGAQVLVVDDDTAEAHQIAEKLRAFKIQTMTVSRAQEAVRLADEKNYDLMIISATLGYGQGSAQGDGQGDGLRLCVHFRSHEKTRTTPLLIVIEDDNTEVMVKGLDMGINDYLVTPLDSNELIARVNIQIRRKKFQDALKASQKENLSLAITDGLTGLYNRRYFDMHIEIMLKKSLEDHKPLSLMLLDLDHFKSVNDECGHQSGDEVLRQLAGRLTPVIRPTDLVARYGGEEFVIVMSNTTITHAAEVGERIRKVVELGAFSIPVAPHRLHKTVSIGLTCVLPADTVHTLIERADKALYHVKNSGRNRVAVLFPKQQ